MACQIIEITNFDLESVGLPQALGHPKLSLKKAEEDRQILFSGTAGAQKARD